jgi:hypothetical protein
MRVGNRMTLSSQLTDDFSFDAVEDNDIVFLHRERAKGNAAAGVADREHSLRYLRGESRKGIEPLLAECSLAFSCPP